VEEGAMVVQAEAAPVAGATVVHSLSFQLVAGSAERARSHPHLLVEAERFC